MRVEKAYDCLILSLLTLGKHLPLHPVWVNLPPPYNNRVNCARYLCLFQINVHFRKMRFLAAILFFEFQPETWIPVNTPYEESYYIVCGVEKYQRYDSAYLYSCRRVGLIKHNCTLFLDISSFNFSASFSFNFFKEVWQPHYL